MEVDQPTVTREYRSIAKATKPKADHGFVAHQPVTVCGQTSGKPLRANQAVILRQP